MASEKDKVIKNVRACLISSPSGTSVADLNSDYRSLVGENIPYKRLGYEKLEEFLQILPNVDIVNRGGQWHVVARADAGSSHVAKLVQGQKKVTKKPRKAKFSTFRFGRAPPPKLHATNQIPHFMKQSSQRNNPPVRHQAHYIAAPSQKPVKTYPANGTSQNANQNLSNRTTKYVAPEDLPVTTYSKPQSSSLSTQKPSEKQPDKNASSSSDQTANIPPLKSVHTVYKKPPEPAVQSSAPTSRPPLLPTPKTPADTWKPYVQKPKMSVADRLNVYKKNNMSSISEVQVATQNGDSSHGDSQVDSYSEAVTHYGNNKPEFFEVKVVDPISWSKDKSLESDSQSQVPQSPSKTFKNVNLESYNFDKGTYIFKLIRYVEDQNWHKPDFFVLCRRVGSPKYPENQYICRVSVNCSPIGSKSGNQATQFYEFSSYPEEFPDVNSAMIYVSKKAYEALIEKETIQLPETKDIDIILGRISEMVKGKEQGVWLYQIEKMYKAQFNECLPKNLPSLMAKYPSLEISKLTEAYYIVRPKKEEADSTKYFSPTYVNNLTVNKLTYPADDSWDVFVSKVKSLNEMYIRIIGDKYSQSYETLAVDLEAHYLSQETARPENIEVGKYYALVTDDSCFRVLVTTLSDKQCQVYLIDVGDVDIIETDLLRVLLPKFYTAASQAVPCFLDGLHNYDFCMTNYELNDAIYEMVLAKSFVGLLSNRDPIHLTLYDTEEEEVVNVNLALKQLIDDSFTSPGLFEEGTLAEILVTSVDGNGLVYIQKPSWTLRCLIEKITLIGNGYYEVSYLNSTSEASKDKIYFWCNGPTRVKVVSILSSEELIVDFIDTGGQKTVHLSEIYEIELLDDLLPKIPPQAVPVHLHDVNNGTLKAHQVQKFLDLINSHSSLPTIGKVVSFSGGYPQMEIFVRNETNNLLVSVNSNLSLSETMSSRTSQLTIDKGSTYSTTTLSHTDGNFLTNSIIPNIGDELPIYVSGLANPLNFTVTPVSHLKHLNALAEEMIIFYSSTSTDEVYKPRVGECVAAQSEGCWFRVQIDRKLDNDLYCGKYLDHGHMDAFPVKAIRGLPEKFKKLPCLAFRAQLHGIKPINKDWSVDDCLAVKSMLHNKTFFSLVRDIINDADGRKLSLEIIDTSTDNDVYISRQLVMENRALPNN